MEVNALAVILFQSYPYFSKFVSEKVIQYTVAKHELCLKLMLHNQIKNLYISIVFAEKSIIT